MIIVVSFLPVFLLTGEEGRLFHPLAFTKTFAIAAASILSITLVPILMMAWMRGTDPLRGRQSGRARDSRRLYAPVLNIALRYPKTALLLNFLLIPAVVPLALSLGSEFMPQLREGSLMYMPTGLPMMAVEQAREILVKTDGMIMTFPEVQVGSGQVGEVRELDRSGAHRDVRDDDRVEAAGRVAPDASTAAGIRAGRIGSSLSSDRSGPRCGRGRRTSCSRR